MTKSLYFFSISKKCYNLEPCFFPSQLDPVFTAEPLGLVHQRYFVETFEPKLFLAEPEILLEPEPEPACPEST